MKVLVVGGIHGNEPLGLGLVDDLTVRPLENVDLLLGNPQARKADKRFIVSDLNRVFPGDVRGNLEQRRAAEIMQEVDGYDVVLDFHNTHCPDNDCGLAAATNFDYLSDIAARMNLTRMIRVTGENTLDYDSINKFVPNCLSVEISLASKRCNVTEWRSLIARLAAGDLPAQSRPASYRFAHRVTREDQDRLQFSGWHAFEPLSAIDTAQLGLSGESVPIFIEDAYTPYNYAGVLQPE